MKPLGAVTMIVPFYCNPRMLAEHVTFWNLAPEGMRFIVVDDGSPAKHAAAPVIEELATADLLARLSLYRITVDIPWNRGGARNLGTKLAETDWIIHVDVDHVMPPASYAPLLAFKPMDKAYWFRFPRWRVGAADETRKKDKIDPKCEFGQIHPHVDSFLCTRELFWAAGGYDEDYSGCLGGGTPFTKNMERLTPARMLPESIKLHVYTRHVIKDSSDWKLTRNTEEYKKRRKAKEVRGPVKGTNHIRFPWERVL